MIDIVERLRVRSPSLNEAEFEKEEAANEIERLRKELSYRVHTDEDIEVQNKEIERLRADGSDARASILRQCCGLLANEIERLRGLLANSELTVNEVMADNERLRAQNAELQEALRKVAQLQIPWQQMPDMARAAIAKAEKPP
jgi:hypothetical protein